MSLKRRVKAWAHSINKKSDSDVTNTGKTISVLTLGYNEYISELQFTTGIHQLCYNELIFEILSF